MPSSDSLLLCWFWVCCNGFIFTLQHVLEEPDNDVNSCKLQRPCLDVTKENNRVTTQRARMQMVGTVKQ